MKKYILALISIIWLGSCTEPQPEHFMYKIIVTNKYNSTVGIKPNEIKFDTIYIYPDSSYISLEQTDSGPVAFYSDSLEIIYYNRKKLYTGLDTSSRNPLQIKNYDAKENSLGYIEYTYTITEQDYLNAEPIE